MIIEKDCYKKKKVLRVLNIFTLLVLIFYIFLYFNGTLDDSINDFVIIITLIFLEISYIREYISFLRDSEDEIELKYTDLHTSVYNKSGCEKLFNNFTPFDKSSGSYILIFDMNDLKKINDNMGHKYGDDLIKDFATILNISSKEILNNPFVGRFGGDEFIVFFFSNDKDIINKFLDKVRNLTEKFNCCNKIYSISYAVGYAYSNDYKRDITIKDLLEIADKSMYENKVKIKNDYIKNHF